MTADSMLIPQPLKAGDRIAIVCPASTVADEHLDGAAEALRRLGFEPVMAPHAKGPHDGSYSAAAEERIADFVAAYTSDARALLCGRGGYGCVHLLGSIDREMLRRDPKWVIGFSDVSALHALSQHAGVASLHASMARHLATRPDSHEVTRLMTDILTGQRSEMEYTVPADPRNISGRAHGRLRGGNLAVLNGLASTPYDMLLLPDTILFIEDVAEPVYKVERVLHRLYMAGCFTPAAPGALRGLVVGRFTLYEPNRDFGSMEDMISFWLHRWKVNIPVAFGFDIGHVERNLPVVEGASATLDVTSDGVSLSFAIKK
ncbi:MAG: LD-carboxypeptidase [Bacteroides sp.]|nr:LD-carboxypeptidase [Bacteroides sp.]